MIVRNHSNEIEYEGPWVTPQDKAAPPSEIRKRIERVDKRGGRFGIGGIDLGGDIEFDILPEFVPVPDAGGIIPDLGIFPDVPPPPPAPVPPPVRPPLKAPDEK